MHMKFLAFMGDILLVPYA